jgi:peptidoglycan/LPS O-acetylase OafA/YrhL
MQERIGFLDALRGIGALAVVISHSLVLTQPAFRDFSARFFDLGQFGVVLFLIVSGYIIPASIERSGSRREFWRKRFFRLFPLYWLTLLVIVMLAATGAAIPSEDFRQNLMLNSLLNLTMVQHWGYAPMAMGAYWTLSAEIAFYALCSVWLMSRLPPFRQILWALGSLTLVLGVLVVSRAHVPVYSGLIIYAALAGTLVYKLETGSLARREACIIATVLVVGAIGAAGLRLLNLAAEGPAMGAMLPAWGAAFLVFLLAFRVRQRPYSQWARWLGRISYSTYLLHSIVLLYVPRELNSAAHLALTLGATLVLSVLSYQYVELPFIRYAARKRAHAPASDPLLNR